MNKTQSYINDVHITCNRLDISVYEYMQFRKLGRALRKIYTDQCNGYQDSEGKWDSVASDEATNKEIKLAVKTKKLAKSLGLHMYLQGDPRGAVIYLSREPIPENNYNKAECIY